MNRFSDIDCSFKKLQPVYGYRSQKLVTIEKALESIQSQIDELPYYIKTAKKHCHFPSEHGLTHDESAAIYIYTMEWDETSLYRLLNKALRAENRQELKIWFPYLKLFDTALDKLPTVKQILWRGVSLDIGKNFTKNQIVTWWTINSCSSSVDIIKDFLGDNKTSTLFLIEAINGKQVTGYTQFENEDEVILRMGTQFRVKSNALEQSNGSIVVHLIEIDEDSDEENVTSAMNNMQMTQKPSNQDRLVATTYDNPQLRKRIANQKTNEKVDLNGLSLEDSDTSIIVQEVMNNKKCKELMLHHNKITSVGVSILSNALNNNYDLDLLELWDNRVSDMGAHALAKPLSLNNNHLTGLGLGENNITDEGAQALSNMLKTNKTLNWLGLHANKIGDEGVQLMANALEKNQNTRLKKLHIFSNKWVSDSSVDALVDMITQNQSLTELMVHDCSITEEGKDRLFQANKSREQPLDLRL